MNHILPLAEVANNSGFTGMLISFGPFILIIVVMYFLLFRSQQKKNKERQQMLNSMRTGDKVLTAGGIIGTISAIKEKTMAIKIAENVKIEVMRSSVNGIIEKGSEGELQP